jgi:hypothetical protein
MPTLHLVETELLATGHDFTGGQTNAHVGLQQLLGHDTGGTGLHLFLLVVVDTGILRLELLDQSVNVLVLVFIVYSVDLGGQGLFVVLPHVVLRAGQVMGSR